jgi:hypothetical protein
MCGKCDEVAALIEQTRDGKSVVAWAFPGGKPELVTRPAPEEAATGGSYG